ncbi:MAG: HEAT repeat domain-containing protein [Bryobacteraceae bacterium]|jgi:anti-sigma factor RsiW
MSCHEISREIPLYCYGEVSSEVEERVEAHLAECPDCRSELARHRAFLEMIDQREDVEDASLLSACRVSLRNALREDAKPAHRNWSEMLRGFWRLDIPFRIPVGAMALMALGFFAARFTPAKFGGVQAGLAEPMFSSVRSVEPDASGKVQIAVDEVRRHVVTGTLQDRAIQDLLLTAVREESNPGVRVESIGVLQSGGDSTQVRQALIDALTHDPNATVRLKALEGLKSYAADATVRKTLANVLLKDDDPNVRVQAIDLLTAHHDDSIVGVLQDVVQKEDNSYVRTRTTKLLEEMKASVGTY